MKTFKRVILALIIIVIFSFFYYVLPQHDIVRVNSTEVIRTDFTRFNRLFYAQADAGNLENTTRDVRLINTVRKNGKVMVYRNEDTGWIWPPYFKFDSSNLQAEAADLIAPKATPQWAVVTHYGVRIPFLSIYPNAVSIRAVESQDVRIIPWVNIVILTILAFFVFMLRRMWLQFRERSIDPMLENAGETWDAVDDRADAARGRFTRWLGSWKSKPPK